MYFLTIFLIHFLKISLNEILIHLIKPNNANLMLFYGSYMRGEGLK
jgi:hypothetical protein